MAAKDLIRATSSLTKASQCREDTAILSKAHANWEEYLTPAPMSIAFLGELIFISSKQDFSIKAGEPTGGFMFIKYPDSFRACLLQVCNSGWEAFNEAHKSMDQIRLHTQNVPPYIKAAVEILVQNDDVLVKSLLPDTLDSINNISASCVELAKSVENKFAYVTKLISELLETCTSAKQSYGTKMKEVRKMLEYQKLQKEILEKENELAEKEYVKLQKLQDKTYEDFKKAMDSLPSGWDMIGMNFVEAINNVLNIPLQLPSLAATILTPTSVNNVLTAAFKLPSLSASLFKKTLKNPINTFATNEVLCQSPLLLVTAQTLDGFIQKDKIEWSKVVDEKTGTMTTDWLVEQIENLLSSIEQADQSPTKTQAEQMCQQIITICADLSSMALDGQQDNGTKNKKVIKQIKKVMNSAMKFDCSAKKITQTSALPVTSPGMSKVQSSSSGSAGQMASENARFRIEQMKAQFENASEKYERSLEKMEDKQRGLAEILNKLRNSEVQDIEFGSTIKMLAEGLQAMGILQEKWRKMVQFFQMISNIINTCLKTSLQDFTKKSQNLDLKYGSNFFLKDMIYRQAFEASNIANLVNMISGTYTEISSEYLMDRINSLGRLMTLDPNDPSFKTERLALAASCDDAEKQIRACVVKNKELYKINSQARLQLIENELKSILPPPSEKETKEMQIIVASGFKDDRGDVDQFY
ncbi:uncharacterized protein LOC105027184 [Esox lucius]|uniref:Uncharacterized protein n=1 Tax=Esox lucius TaxID=8010 RepID=A0AAY5JXU2_ESOLU|nr:uncharacterized protein LOC105027184 [Esox lucius]